MGGHKEEGELKGREQGKGNREQAPAAGLTALGGRMTELIRWTLETEGLAECGIAQHLKSGFCNHRRRAFSELFLNLNR
jgi:hypothetical protein